MIEDSINTENQGLLKRVQNRLDNIESLVDQGMEGKEHRSAIVELTCAQGMLLRVRRDLIEQGPGNEEDLPF